MSNERIFWRGAWMIVTCVATSSATGGCKDARDDAAAASTPATPPTISIPPDVDGLRIKPPASDEVVLTKTGGTWKLTAPSPGDADPSKVQAVLDNLASIKVVDTVSTKPDDDQKKLYQLDADHAVHVVVSKGGATILDASFGKSSGRGEMAQIAPSSAVYALSGYSSYLYGAGDAARFRSKGASADALAVQAAAQAAAASAAQLKASAKIERTGEDDKCVSDGKPPRGLSITGGTYDHNYEVATSMGCVRSHVYYPQQGHTVIDNYYCCP